jgi:Na+-driven multidrug efflux pump
MSPSISEPTQSPEEASPSPRVPFRWRRMQVWLSRWFGYNTNLTAQPVGSLLLQLSVPISWGLVCVLGANLLEAAWLTRLGPSASAAFTLTFPVSLFITNLGNAISVAVTTQVAQQLGIRDKEKARRKISDALAGVLVFGALLIALIALIQVPLFSALGGTTQTLHVLSPYLDWYLPSLILFLLTIVGGAVLRATGDAFFPSFIMSLSAGLNLLLDWFALQGLLSSGPATLEAFGVAMCLARLMAAAVTYLLLRRRGWLKGMGHIRDSESWQDLGELLKLAIPAWMGLALLPVALSIITKIVALYGQDTLSGYGLAYRFESFLLIGYLALASAVLTFTGHNVGAQHWERVCKGFQTAAWYCLWIGVLGCLTLPWFKGVLIEPLIKALPAEGQRFIHLYLNWMPFSYAGIGWTLCSVNFLNALSKPMNGVWLSLLRLFGWLLPWVLLGHSIAGLNGVVGGMAFANLSSGIFSLILARRCFRAEAGQSLHNAGIPKATTVGL